MKMVQLRRRFPLAIARLVLVFLLFALALSACSTESPSASALNISTDNAPRLTSTARAEGPTSITPPTKVATRAPTSTVLPSRTPTRTATPSPTATATHTASPTRTPTRTAAPTRTPTVTPIPTVSPVEVHFIDVGQGDAILIRGSGATVLIDGGDAGSGALAYLRSVGVERLDAVIATHPHADHIGGLVDVLRALPVDTVVTNGYEHTTQVYERFLDAIIAAQADYVEVGRGDRIEEGGLVFDVLGPASSGDDLNNGSLVLRLVHGSVAFLLAGDIESESESVLLASGLNIGAQVLKVAHHGSSSSTSPAFLRGVGPDVAVYTAGRGNSYGHPHAQTLASLAGAGTKTYGTDVNGTVVVVSDGTTYKVTSARQGEPSAPPIATATVVKPTAVPVPVQPTAAPAPQPTAVPPPQPTAPPAEPTAAPPPPVSALGIEVVSLTSPISAGSNATLTVRTAPGAACTITVYYKSGPSEAAGLGPQNADGNGTVSWTWKVGTRTTPGTWRIVVTASANGQNAQIEIPFEVR